MPDLSEDMNDEERIWEEIHEIKRMPVRMAQKKELKAQLQVRFRELYIYIEVFIGSSVILPEHRETPTAGLLAV